MKVQSIVVGWGVILGVMSLACMADPDAECPASPEVEVSLTPGEEDVRTLPVVESGSRSLLGQSLADSHGEVAAAIGLEEVDEVDLVELSFDVSVDENPLTIDITRQTSGGEEVDASAQLGDQSSLRTFFRADDLADIVLPEGVPYTATYRVEWKKEFPGMCPPVREGVETVEVSGHVAAAVESGSFVVRGTDANQAEAPETAGGAKFKLFAEISSGITANIRDVRTSITYFGAEGAVPALGLATLEDPAVLVDGAKSQTVAPGQVVEIYSTASPSDDPPPYEAAGTSATTGNVGGGKALIEVTIEYELTDGTAGVETDTLVHAVDVAGDGSLL